MRCSSGSTCVRMQCASALRRFSRYVSRELAEAVTFCQCTENDSECITNRVSFISAIIIIYLKLKPIIPGYDTSNLYEYQA